MNRRKVNTVFCFFLFLAIGSSANAQFKVKGVVYDSSRQYRIDAVTVMSTGGRMTMTDSLGRYSIEVSDKDSIWFSFLGKPTPKYAVLKMADINQFDISLKLKSHIMDEVRIKNRSYKMDSLQNRKDYAKGFNYQKVSLGSMTSIGPAGAGIDLDELIRLFQFRKNKAALKFQQRLVDQEREKFVDHRFSKSLVKRLTELDGSELDHFMLQYRPTYEFTASASEYDFQLFIKRAFEIYKTQRG